jgi:lipopolysaccharide transport protein LptA
MKTIDMEKYKRTIRRLCFAIILSFLSVSTLCAAEEMKEEEITSNASTNGTLITSKSLLFEQKKGEAVFEGNVVVTDPDIKINSDKLIVFFDEDHKITRIEAIGSVVIIKDDIKTNSKKAEFEVESGKVVLSGSPRVKRGKDTLAGDTITFWQNDDRILCEPNATLFIRSNQKSFSVKDSLKH